MINKFFKIQMYFCKKGLNFLFITCCLLAFAGNVQAQQGAEPEQDEPDIEINDMSSISTDPRPFKRRALPKKAPQPEITSAEQMRQMLGSPHEMSETPAEAASSMPRGFSVSNPQENQSVAPKQRPVRSAFPARPRRGGAGGITRPEAQPATSSLARQKLQATREKRAAEKQANPTPKEQLVQEGLKMFDEQTAKQVMDIQPNAKELEKLSPEARQRVLDSIEVNKSAPAQPAGKQQKGTATRGPVRNVKGPSY